MAQRRVLIDCDPGQDDAINLFLALASPDELEIIGITTVAGNVPLELTQRNARLVCDIAERHDVPVFAGCSRPLKRALVTAESVHGKTGLGGIDIIEPQHPLTETHAVDFIVDSLLRESDESLTLVITGPLTNIATAIVRNPAIVAKIAEIVLMGGAMREGGNYSPSAEFNVLVDPHAAKIVMECGRPITVLGLDATHQVLATTARRERIRAIPNNAGRAAAAMLDFYMRQDPHRFGDTGVPLHDPCTVAWLLKRELFDTKRCNLAVETESELTIGHTAVDFWAVTDRAANVDWVYRVNANGFYDLLVERLGRFSSN